MPLKKKITTILIGLFLLALPMVSSAQSKPGSNSRGGECSLFIPTAFTPNDDGVNDQFTIRSSEHCIPASYTLKVFDRWGRMVYQSNDLTQHWDGRYDGQFVREGVYLYTISVTFENSITQELSEVNKKGSVIILR